MNTFQLGCFLTVAETLNFARAAEELNITQPAVTHQIRTLEAELNAKLFKRTTRIVEMTTAGHLFLNDAKNILAISRRAKRRFENPSEQEVQTFSIGCHSYAPLFLLPEILRRIAALYPRLHPQLRSVPFQHLYRLLEEEDVDAVIGFQESAARKIPGFYKELKKVPITCVCSRESPLAAHKSVKITDLENEKFVPVDPVKSPLAITELQGKLVFSRSHSDFYFCESTETALVLVESGFGVSVLPDLFIPPDSSLVKIPVEGTESMSFGVYYKTLQGNLPLKDFIRITKDYFKNEP